MTLADDFPDEMGHSVSIAAVSEQGLYGPVYGEDTVYSCLVKEEVQNIIDKNGTEAVSHCQIYLDGSVTVNDNDRVTYDSKILPILRVANHPDENVDEYATVVYT